ncbi:MAG TPA: branched-chain amino acid transport system II carrier protein, partial [Chlamydiales bacterium]|nr:branched-chain amino acid transport system II carrier protein [Chlamydiales bacterium]
MNIFAKRLQIISVGFAMFSMFFGAGNVVFPLIVGTLAQDRALYALLGLVITAVGVPFLGLFGMTLFEGDYRAFFARLGKWPGFLIILVIMGLIGPFGAIPRCITLSYSTVKLFFGETPLLIFSVVSCVLIFLLTVKKSRITDVLGYILTPLLLVSLAVIIIKGALIHPEPSTGEMESNMQSFLNGLLYGYHTMDLLGAFFFCAVVIDALKALGKSHRSIHHNTYLASTVGAGLLAAVYVGMCFVAAMHSMDLTEVPADQLLGKLALSVLGPYAGVITCTAVALACLTTAIALSAVFAEFVHNDIVQDRLNYEWSLAATLVVTFVISTLEFNGILLFLAPIVQVIYPALVMLCIVNIAYKLWGFKYVKLPVALTFAISLII